MKKNLILTNGLHMILMYFNIFKTLRERGDLDTINVSPDYKALFQNRNDIDEYYLEKYHHLLDMIFSKVENVNLIKSNKIINKDDLESGVDFASLLSYDLIKIYNNNFIEYSEEYASQNHIENNKKFIVINTKIVNCSSLYWKYKSTKNNAADEIDCILHWNKFKNKMYEILNSCDIEIVLIGERNIPDCNEYNFHRDNIGNYVMYNDHISNLKKFRDETYYDSKDSYDFELFKKTCYYLNNSIMNIYVGNGGGVHLYSQFKNLYQFGEFDRLLEYLPSQNILTNPQRTLNPDNFLEMIKNNIIIHKKNDYF